MINGIQPMMFQKNSLETSKFDMNIILKGHLLSYEHGTEQTILINLSKR